MKYLAKGTKCCLVFFMTAPLLMGCTTKDTTSILAQKNTFKNTEVVAEVISTEEFVYEVSPENFEVTVHMEDTSLSVANAMEKKTVADLKEEKGGTSWSYPEEKISVLMKKEDTYLSVAITADSTDDTSFVWPNIAADDYYFPLGEGKHIPAQDSVWAAYLGGESFGVLEQFSMPFWANAIGDYAVVYIMEDPHRSEISFQKGEKISFEISYEYPNISKNKTKRFRIYVTENNPVAVAKIYRNYTIEKEDFLTLEQKAKEVPAIEKLYGAPFIYLWGSFILSPADIQWDVFKKAMDSPTFAYLLSFADTQENGVEFIDTLAEIKNQEYVAAYQKNVICSYLSGVLKEENFWDATVFTNITPAMDELLKKGKEYLTNSQKIQLHKYALEANSSGLFEDVTTWMNDGTVDLIEDMKKEGIENAWIGLHGWEQAFAKPALVDTAAEQGYLVASYDSYHSIHEPGKEQWETAKFADLTLYDEATVSNREGKKIGGFQNVGRKLNPVLAMPSVIERMQNIIEKNQLAFNSWFIDCDATGEIYDDYSAAHITTEEADIAARMQRMSYIRDTYQMVVGSEGGNDFAAGTIAFAHGIELRTFSWMDEDMKKNKDSEYYIGKYFNPAGGVAEHFSKRVPVKEKYHTLFLNPSYDVPLFKLVYNDAVITSYHWDWSTFKIKNETQNRMVREMLYNVPPLYHLDVQEWAKYKDDIVSHTEVWSNFSKQAIKEEMTDFKYLSTDRLVQLTQYGKDIRVIANFTDMTYEYEGKKIPGGSALIDLKGDITIYTPTVKEAHQ